MLDFLKENITVWQHLKTADKPIAIYGMGDGADKILSVFDKFEIRADAIFASDEFVRGHYFHGLKVEKLSEVEERLGDFIIVMSFATQRPEVLDRVFKIAEKHELVAPDVPVAGDGLFDLDFVKMHEDKIEKVYNALADEKSKAVFADTINFKISGKIEYLKQNISTREEIYRDLIFPTPDEHFVDLGAYNGDTVREFLNACGGKYKQITAFEPDRRNYKKLADFCEGKENVTAYNLGAHSHEDTLIFADRGGRNSSLFKKGREVEVSVNSVDNICKIPPTIIKFDVEGAEELAIKGCEKTIKNHRPKLLVASYHRNEDNFALPLQILKLNPDYKIYFRREAYIPAWETNFIFKEK